MRVTYCIDFFYSRTRYDTPTPSSANPIYLLPGCLRDIFRLCMAYLVAKFGGTKHTRYTESPRAIPLPAFPFILIPNISYPETGGMNTSRASEIRKHKMVEFPDHR